MPFTRGWPPPKLSPYKRIECILGPKNNGSLLTILNSNVKTAINNSNDNNKKLADVKPWADAKPISPEDANKLDKQAEDDITQYKAFFAVLERWTHPVNIRLLEPFQQLLELARLVKANCPLNDFDDQKPADGSGTTPLELLRAQAAKVVKESNQAAKDFDDMTIALGKSNEESANKSSKAIEHLTQLRDGIRSLEAVVLSAQDQLKTVNPDRDRFEKDLNEKKEELVNLKDRLERVDKSIDAIEYAQQNTVVDDYSFGSDIGGDLLLNAKYGDQQTLKISIKSVRELIGPLETNFNDAKAKKEKWDDVVRKTTELKQKLEARVTKATEVRTEAAKWSSTIASLSTKYNVVNSHVGILAKSTDTLDSDLKYYIPSRALYSKHILSVVDYGSMFSNRPGLLDELKNVCQELRKANDLDSPDNGQQVNRSEDYPIFKVRLEQEEAHLLRVETKLKSGGHSQDLEMIKPLSFAGDETWYIPPE